MPEIRGSRSSVPDPEVVVLALYHVREGHKVGGHDLVHSHSAFWACSSWSRPPLDVPATRSGAAGWRMQARAPQASTGPEAAGRQEIHDGVGVDLPQPSRDRDRSRWMCRGRSGSIARGATCRMFAGRAVGSPAPSWEESPAPPRAAPGRSRDQVVHFDRVAAVQLWPTPIERHEASAGWRRPIFSACVYGTILSMCRGTRGSAPKCAGGRRRRRRRWPGEIDSTSGVVSPAQATLSSMPLSEWGSGRTRERRGVAGRR